MGLNNNDWIELWADYYKNNSEEARAMQMQLINTEIEMKNTALKWLAQQPGGREKLTKIAGITNQKFLDRFCRKEEL